MHVDVCETDSNSTKLDLHHGYFEQMKEGDL